VVKIKAARFCLAQMGDAESVKEEIEEPARD
jgi:hypothetical protein